MDQAQDVRCVLFVGQEPGSVDFSDPALPPGFDAKKIHAGIDIGMRQMAARMMMLEFPSFDEAKTWYNNRSYQAACEHRFKRGDYRAFIIEGVAPAMST